MILAIKESYRIQLIIVNDTNNVIDDEYVGVYIAKADKLVIHTGNILKITRKREMKVNNK